MVDQIYTLLPRAAAEIGVVEKGSSSAGLRYKFRGIDDTIAAVHPVFARMGISLGSSIVNVTRERVEQPKLVIWTIITIQYRFTGPDGSSLTFSAVGEGADYGGDKSANKAMSAALKYALGQALLLPYGGIDSENARHDVSTPAQPSYQAQPAQQQRQHQPAQPAQPAQQAQPSQPAAQQPQPTQPPAHVGGDTSHGYILRAPKYKGLNICDPAVETGYLEWMARTGPRTDNPQYAEQNRAEHASVLTEIARRKGGGQIAPPQNIQALAAGQNGGPTPEDHGLPAEGDYPW